MFAKIWLRVTVPIQSLLLIALLVTGLGANHFSPRVFEIVHKGGGLLFVALTVVHVALNRVWIKKNYFKKS